MLVTVYRWMALPAKFCCPQSRLTAGSGGKSSSLQTPQLLQEPSRQVRVCWSLYSSFSLLKYSCIRCRDRWMPVIRCLWQQRCLAQTQLTLRPVDSCIYSESGRKMCFLLSDLVLKAVLAQWRWSRCSCVAQGCVGPVASCPGRSVDRFGGTLGGERNPKFSTCRLEKCQVCYLKTFLTTAKGFPG